MTRLLDDVDRGILRALQRDARNTTAQEMAEAVGVSASTVRNRIDRLEGSGVVQGYVPRLDYGAAGLPVQALLVCSAPVTGAHSSLEDLVEIGGVVAVARTVTDRDNVYARVPASNVGDVQRVIGEFHDVGLRVERAALVGAHRDQPCNHPAFASPNDDP